MIQESFNQWVLDTLDLIDKDTGGTRLETEALLKESIKASQNGLEIPQELSKHLLNGFHRYFINLEDQGTTSDPAMLAKELGLGGKKPKDNAGYQFVLHILFKRFMNGFKDGYSGKSKFNEVLSERSLRVRRDVINENWAANHEFFYKEGVILGQTKPRTLLRKHITDMIQDTFYKDKSLADKYYKDYKLSPKELGYEQPCNQLKG